MPAPGGGPTPGPAVYVGEGAPAVSHPGSVPPIMPPLSDKDLKLVANLIIGRILRNNPWITHPEVTMFVTGPGRDAGTWYCRHKGQTTGKPPWNGATGYSYPVLVPPGVNPATITFSAGDAVRVRHGPDNKPLIVGRISTWT